MVNTLQPFFQKLCICYDRNFVSCYLVGKGLMRNVILVEKIIAKNVVLFVKIKLITIKIEAQTISVIEV